MDASDTLDRCCHLHGAEHHQDLLGELERGLRFNSVAVSGRLPIVHESELLVFFDDLFHDRASLRHELFELKSFVLRSGPRVDLHCLARACSGRRVSPMRLVVVNHLIFGRLIGFVLLAKVLRLNIALYSLISA